MFHAFRRDGYGQRPRLKTMARGDVWGMGLTALSFRRNFGTVSIEEGENEYDGQT